MLNSPRIDHNTKFIKEYSFRKDHSLSGGIVLLTIHILIVFSLFRYPRIKSRLFPNLNLVYSWSGNINKLGAAIYSAINIMVNHYLTIYVCTTHPEEVTKFQNRLNEIKIDHVKFIVEFHNTTYLTKKVFNGSTYEAYIKTVFSPNHPEIDRFISLDADTLVINNFDKFYYRDFENTYAITVLN
ncbi:hypothetical protein TVAG_445160 [Trichomonas vaginalis G3]|uniref:Glycosyl transferase family 8 protein n=1 Tax=Trichomonas vaginalis (strain ATCC PRA-98 / G3) TaxID=412133 RepID=A2E4I2_TRIV3|nr:glycosyltransferase 8 domain-containing protein family [Trichomonas vaginalis G3]EAY12404.1 hypothetical protein TVAG_445160 [Trichomonas vaginalis G3]KAI5494167.1 glycosyltransferase 8 domain-containing protein family [Trichomonas vaginalis G3]|eukprot:XP_001324627.1 hypothetical protein [Trichomonas vaginalis G3]